MLIQDSTRDALYYGGFAFAAWAAIGAIVVWCKASRLDRSGAVRSENALDTPRALRPYRWCCVALVVVCAAALGTTWWISDFTDHVLRVVQQRGAGHIVEKLRAKPDSNYDVPVSPDATTWPDGDMRPVWVLNESRTPLTMVIAVYKPEPARPPLWSDDRSPPEPISVPPGTRMPFERVDDIGPNSPPPTELRGTYVPDRYWLTWEE